MLSAMVLLPISDALSKLVAADYPAEQITWIRNLVHVALILPLALRRGARLPLGRLHIARAAAFVLMTVLWIAGLRWMPLADAQAVLFTFPLMVTAWSAVTGAEAVGIVRWGAVAAGMGGMLLVVQPGFAALGAGTPLVFLAAISAAAYIVLTRRLAGTAPRLMMLAMPAVVALVAMTPLAAWKWIMPDWADLGVMFVIGAMAAVIHLLLIVAYDHAEASALAPMAYLQIPVGVFLGWRIFGDLPGVVASVGIAVLILSGIVISVREHRRR